MELPALGGVTREGPGLGCRRRPGPFGATPSPSHHGHTHITRAPGSACAAR
ncbi:hypothetical protein STAFG_0752 [Streptomyces afghaniensis 772]|uniref:Uncharacterized protein n=1 Tax=Streptomyces afghaniensis 772 TaxID=1283301 RepID=S4MRP4_9ACTN|nr:hypothetical protein STAFG_0752 [Streptomyces afghaniensis 772]